MPLRHGRLPTWVRLRMRGGVVQLGRRDDRGAVAVLVALLMTTLLGLTALVVDVGMARDRIRAAETAVDSAALAAALVMYQNNGAMSARTAARQSADAYLLSNYTPPADRSAQFAADWAACTACVVFTDTTVTVTLVPLPAEDVRSPASFGAVYGVQDFPTAATATATWASPLAGDCLLCVVDDALFDDYSHGVGVVSGGNTKVGDGLIIQSPGALTVRTGHVFRGSPVQGTPTVDTGYQVLNLTGFTDPYAAGPAHDPWALIGQPSAVQPAYYDSAAGRCQPQTGSQIAAITAADASACPTFAPGLYAIYPGVRRIIAPLGTGYTSNVTPKGGGTGVLLFLTCNEGTPGSNVAPCSSTNRDGARLDRIGGSLTLKGITSTTGVLSPLRGFTLIIDRYDTGSSFGYTHVLGSTISGNLTVYGNVYAPDQDLVANDNITVYGQVIVGSDLTVGSGLECTGVCLTVNAPTLVTPPVPPSKVRLLPGS